MVVVHRYIWVLLRPLGKVTNQVTACQRINQSEAEPTLTEAQQVSRDVLTVMFYVYLLELYILSDYYIISYYFLWDVDVFLNMRTVFVSFVVQTAYK